MKIAITTVEQFKDFSGLKLNRQKSEGIWMGPRKHDRGKINDIPMKERIKILGVWYSAELEASTVEANWNNKIENVLKVIKRWENRDPTLYGKVILAKSVLLSQLSHCLQVLAIPKNVLARINTIIYRFLWKRKYNNKKTFEKIKRRVLCLDVNEGGIKNHQHRTSTKNVPHKIGSKVTERQRFTLVRYSSTNIQTSCEYT